jgi:iron complex outermembrane receptor protein
VAAEDRIVLFDDRLWIAPALRWEGLRDEAPPDPRLAPVLQQSGTVDRSVWSPRLGLRAEPWRGVALLANAGRYERVPSLQELFGASGTIVGNPDLRSEKTINWDVGARLSRERLGRVVSAVSLEYAWFDNRIDDVIVVVPASVSVFTSRNVSAARVRGHEVSATLRAWDRLGLALNYTNQDAVDESGTFNDGNKLPGRPAHEAYARVELGWSPEHPLPVGTWAAHLWPGRLWGDVNLIADNYLDTANTERVPRRDLAGVGLEVQAPWKLRLGVEVRNLNDDQTRDALDFPLPGRAVYGTVSWGF